MYLPRSTELSLFRTTAPDRFHHGLIVFLAFIVCLFVASGAYAQKRTLSLYYTHTKESLTVTYKKNGKFVPSGLKKLNRLLRDFRRNEPTRMDPALFDLVWEVYQKSGSKKPIHVISGYRSPRTNNMLRRRGRKVARNSQHTKGKALDFFLPDVPVTKLRALGLKAHGGGVGYYRGSFVHLDTGRVRHWPRMSRRQLAKVFPRGRTIHVPTDGRPMKGYKTAAANLKKGLNYDGSRRRIRSNTSLIAGLFKNSDEEKKETPRTQVARPASKPKADVKPVQTAKRSSGPDPFALEAKAVQTPKKEEKQESTTEIAALPAKLPVPKRRPAPAGEQAPIVVAEAEVDKKKTEKDVAQLARETQLALATPEPSVDVLADPNAVPTPQPRAEQAQTEADIVKPAALKPVVAERPQRSPEDREALENLRSRIQLALAKQRELNGAEQAATAQAIGKPTLRDQIAEQGSEVASSSEADAADKDIYQIPTPSWREDEGERSEEVLVASREPDSERVTAARAESSANAALVPAPGTSLMTGELQLGNLDGDGVRAWAVAVSTRVGPIASLTAPNYRLGASRAAPLSVYSAGFANNRSPLRADRFSGRALTRVAFAHFGY